MEQLNLADLLGDATWLAHRYDPVADAYHMRAVGRAEHDQATFLTDEYLGAEYEPVVVDRRQAVALVAPDSPLHFIFHSAFCASTMLARGFDLPDHSMGLKEPVLLNDVIGWRRRGAAPAAVAERLDHSLRMLARPFGEDRAVVVKPSNVFNSLAAAALTIRPESRAVLLYAPLPVFLVSVARKGLWCRLWCRELLEGLITDGIADLGFTPAELFRQSDLQIAAVGWLVQHRLFHQLAAKFGPERIVTLDSERLTADPQGAVAAAALHFGLNVPLSMIADHSAFIRHSKLGGSFDTADRRLEHGAARAAYGDEIDKVLVWAEAVAQSVGIDLALPLPLAI